VELDCTTMRILVALDLEERENSHSTLGAADGVAWRGESPLAVARETASPADHD
jgi:hypothetical protein